MYTPLKGCTSFEHLAGDKPGSPVKRIHDCPKGTLFDVSVCVCNHAADVVCPPAPYCQANGKYFSPMAVYLYITFCFFQCYIGMHLCPQVTPTLLNPDASNSTRLSQALHTHSPSRAVPRVHCSTLSTAFVSVTTPPTSSAGHKKPAFGQFINSMPKPRKHDA